MMGHIEFGDNREILRTWAAAGVKVQTCVTSPPYYGLRDYGHDGQIGLEQTPDEYIANMVDVFRGVRDVLADDGTLWLNLGDSYASSTKGSGGGWAADPNNYAHKAQAFGARKFSMGDTKPKDLMGIPWRVAFALQADGWYLRQDIIWHKPNPMPESVRDRCTKAHEYVFLMSKGPRYYFDAEAIKEPAVTSGPRGGSIYGTTNREQSIDGRADRNNGPRGGAPDTWKTRNRRSVWTVATRPYSGAHFAVFPPQLIEPAVLAGSRVGDVVLDPFMGSGTTAMVAKQHGRRWLGCELNETYQQLQEQRING